jgi:hypothetical protein
MNGGPEHDRLIHRENSMLQLILGGAAIHRRDSGLSSGPALAAEARLSTSEFLFRSHSGVPFEWGWMPTPSGP